MLFQFNFEEYQSYFQLILVI